MQNDNKKYDKRGTYEFFILLISLGAVLAAFRDCIPTVGGWVLLSALPLMWYIMWIVGLNRALIRRTVMRWEYGLYVAVIFLLCLSIPVFGTAMEWGIRTYFHLPHRIHNYLSPWILLDSVSTTTLMIIIMFGMAIGELFLRWRGEVRREKQLAKDLSGRLERFRGRIRAEELLASLQDVTEACRINADLAAEKLRNLSRELRHRLYDNKEVVSEKDVTVAPMSRVEELISMKRYAPLRIIFLEVFLALVSVSSIFIAPDTPDLTMEGFVSFAGMFVVMNILALGNILIARRFIRNGNLVKYMVRGGVFVMVMGIVLIVVQYISYSAGAIGSGLPIVYSILSTIASLAAITLVLGGISAFMALQQWLRGRRRIIKLRMETARVELSFLQSQINPHFLFNVLNNIGMLVYESGEDAADMLQELQGLLRYQLTDAEREYTTIGEEADFISSYLALEKSRKDPFDYTINVPESLRDVRIPTLLIIPFVENAAKHSCAIGGRRDVEFGISLHGESLQIRCVNTFNPALKRERTSASGLGIENTLRRLQLIFDRDFSLSQSINNYKYEVTLIVPVIAR